MLAALRYSLHREPIITWSLLIGGAGLVLPVVVPPVRNMLGFGEQPAKRPPVTAKTLIEASRAQNSSAA
jgi:hypothetical protein